jgi:DNA-binding NtrC family response regulator
MATTGTILIADDEERILRSLARALRQEGHDVAEASSGTAAQRLLSERAFDVAVVDNIMPDLTGLDLIRHLVQHVPAGERPQVVLMTAHATVESAI